MMCYRAGLEERADPDCEDCSGEGHVHDDADPAKAWVECECLDKAEPAAVPEEDSLPGRER
jgi:hypothetical protein